MLPEVITERFARHLSMSKACHRTPFNSQTLIRVLIATLLLVITGTQLVAQPRSAPRRQADNVRNIDKAILIRILQAEDERRWDDDLRSLFANRSSLVRRRAALAAGRIGDERSVSALSALLRNDQVADVRAMAAFALGEVESISGAESLLATLKDTRDADVRARTLEALGKIAGALPKEQQTHAQEIGNAILDALRVATTRRAASNRLTILLGLTAVLRAKPANAGPVIAMFLDSKDPRIRADAGNTLTRLRLNDGNSQLRNFVNSDADPIVRANAARVLGATEDKLAYDHLLTASLSDRDARVRVSAIRALGSLKDGRATQPLIERGSFLLVQAKRDVDRAAVPGPPVQVNELLEIATTLGRLREHAGDERVVNWLKGLRPLMPVAAPELEIALAKVDPASYIQGFGSGPLARRNAQEALLLDWRRASSLAQGLGETASLPDTTRENKQLRAEAEDILRAMLDYRDSGIVINTLVAVHSEYAIPDVLRAYSAFKPAKLEEVLRKHLKESDVIIRATAAELLGDHPVDSTSLGALSDALKVALNDKELNDAALAILDTLGKEKNGSANAAIKVALDSPDHLIRRKAVAALKATGAGDFSSRVGTAKTSNTTADYERALARVGKVVTAAVVTSKGTFRIQFIPDDAPLTVDNFIQLANRGYFRGITIHRVVPNFVIQDGDPRGDGNGGPGYQIRCEINLAPYERGAVGMALSGKDTGGSQWFVTHSPQPHLDGGYTVFGRVIEGMDVVDSIVRGDVIRSVVVTEHSSRRQH